jgi:nucleotide-binding universal stress UspA family protein
MLIMGMHRRGGSQSWHGSIPYASLQLAEMSTVCVPLSSEDEKFEATKQKVESVLVPTDLSPLGNRAVAYAMSLVPNGRLHLLHVLEPPLRVGMADAATPYVISPPDEEAWRRHREDAAQKLEALVPTWDGSRTEIEIVEASNVADAICDAASRLGADMICLASHGRSGISRWLYGSVAQDVMTKGNRPVLVVRQES